MRVGDVTLFLRLLGGECLRWLESSMGDLSAYRNVINSSYVYGRVVLDGTKLQAEKVALALDLGREHCPLIRHWLNENIGVIKVCSKSIYTGSFHFPGYFVCLSGTEVGLDVQELACILFRRIGYARIVNRKSFMAPPALIRAQVMILLLERRLSRRLEVHQAHVEQLDHWIADRIGVLNRCARRGK